MLRAASELLQDHIGLHPLLRKCLLHAAVVFSRYVPRPMPMAMNTCIAEAF